jgi:hypothetical protein
MVIRHINSPNSRSGANIKDPMWILYRRKVQLAV